MFASTSKPSASAATRHSDFRSGFMTSSFAAPGCCHDSPAREGPKARPARSSERVASTWLLLGVRLFSTWRARKGLAKVMDLLAVHWDVGWGADADADPVPLDRLDGHGDVAKDDDFLAEAACQNEHWVPPDAAGGSIPTGRYPRRTKRMRPQPLSLPMTNEFFAKGQEFRIFAGLFSLGSAFLMTATRSPPENGLQILLVVLETVFDHLAVALGLGEDDRPLGDGNQVFR